MSRVKVRISPGSYYTVYQPTYRIVRDDLHEMAAAQVRELSGYSSDDERDKLVILFTDEAEQLIVQCNYRKLSDFRGGWDVTLLLDRWEAFSYYGYDCGDTFG